MTKLFYILLLFSTISWGQNFTYSGYIYNSVGGGVDGDAESHRGATSGVPGPGDFVGHIGPFRMRRPICRVAGARKDALEGVDGVAVAGSHVRQEAVVDDLGHGSRKGRERLDPG